MPALILMYHRVFEPDVDPWGLCVAPRRFAEHAELLRRHYHVMSLGGLVTALENDECSDRAVAISFDDGYADVLQYGVPVLERFDLPATTFLVGRKIDSAEEFWWDELERVFLHPGILPQSLELRLGGRLRHWDLGSDAIYDTQAFEGARDWQPWQGPEPTARQAVFLQVWELLQTLPVDELAQAMDQLRAWAALPAAPRSGYRAVTGAEVKRLDEHPLIEVGAHTWSHMPLSALGIDAQRSEIERSKRDLEALTGNAVRTFAYPYGRRRDYTLDSVELVRQAGFACACSNFHGVITREADRFQLPRINISDWDGETFRRHLERSIQRA